MHVPIAIRALACSTCGGEPIGGMLKKARAVVGWCGAHVPRMLQLDPKLVCRGCGRLDAMSATMRCLECMFGALEE